MGLLLDTHVLLWWLADSAELPEDGTQPGLDDLGGAAPLPAIAVR